MRFAELFRSAQVRPRRRRGDRDVTRVVCDSRQCAPGTCFVAVRGHAEDGHKYIPAAVEAGAAAIVCQDESSVPDGTPCAVVEDTHRALGRLAQAVRGWPARKLTCIGITGTNGKTTVAGLIRAVLAEAGYRPALLGTIAYETGAARRDAATTTPDAVALAELTAEMAQAGSTHLVMEVSSHGLDQHRTSGLDFRVGVFTNLSGDHLDYHKSLRRYRGAKRRLFEQLSPTASAVVNRDDPAADEIAHATPAEVVMYGLNPLAELRARIERIDTAGTRFTLLHAGRTAEVGLKLIGRHNVYNALAAAGACLELGIDLPEVASALGSVDRIPGRLEGVPTGAGYQVFVDYAHTDDALENVLRALRPVTQGRIILLFGCGGDRDRSKRPRMARVAADLADRIVITSDNPRSEDPRAIIEEILGGLDGAGRGKARVEPDRRKAIALAVGEARDGDAVLLAGKGHEPYQIVGAQRRPFDDAEVAREQIRARQEGS